MNKDNLDQYTFLENRYHSAVEEELPEPEMQQFRQMFESAWNQRTLFGRLFAKPLHILIIITFLLITGLSTGYTLISYNYNHSKSPPKPTLMSGQSIANEPELIPLFPKMDHAILITNNEQQPSENQTYLMHGYLADNNIQVVWEY